MKQPQGHLLAISSVIIPLAMKVVCHINDVVLQPVSASFLYTPEGLVATLTTTSEISLMGKFLRYQYDAGAAMDRVLEEGN
jgi:hypothetical protein